MEGASCEELLQMLNEAMTKIAASSTASTSPDEAPPALSAAKPSKRVAKKTTGMTKQVKTVWTSEMVATLLEKRCDDYAASFELNRSAAQLSILWGKIALSINTVHGTNVPALAVKDKYCSLKREYSAIRLAEKSTGNEVTVTYPEYWDELVAALGGMHGLGHHDYAFGASVDDDKSSSDEVVETTSHGKQPLVLDSDMSRQQSKRPKKIDIGQGLVSLGESLVMGLQGLQSVQPSSVDKNESRELLAVVNKLESALSQSATIQNELLSAVVQNTSVQNELLTFLRRNN
ncbi:hypothetical protein AeMF1_004057 [Aphanomyces euteiches]|nr:hypothetical protein AeMF1_004057 [Aphanomyces euteiches]KAH9184086.1 hypothetical protein AeNC1_013938 [Aphanomyces euteiches]